MADNITWVGAAGGAWNTASNWNPAVVPNTTQYGVTIPAGSSIALTSAVTIATLTTTGSGTVTLSGGSSISISSGATLSAGTTLNLGTTVISLDSPITISGSGTVVVSGGTFENTSGMSWTVSTGQTLELSGTSISVGALTGGGTVILNGSTLSVAWNVPSVTIQFATVTSGTQNVLNIPSGSGTLVVQNYGYGDAIYGGGDQLTLKLNSDGTTYSLVDTHGGQWTSTISSSVTLSAAAAAAEKSSNGGTLPSTITLSVNSSGDNYICYYVGTMIAAPSGEVAVENLRAGDLVLTADGRVLPVRWIGVSRVATRFADPLRALPIRVAAGALGDNLPVRDLLVSPEHALFLDGVLVQASALVGFPGITREHDVPEMFNYYHVELETHELLLAEGTPAESFVDNIDRMNFHNWNERSAPVEPIAEMEYPRAKSVRQLPSGLRNRLGSGVSEVKVA